MNKKLLRYETERITERNKAFVEELFLNGFNQTAAYMKAYETDNARYARSQAAVLVQKPSVASFLEQKKAELVKSTQISKEYIVDKLKHLVEHSKNEFVQLQAISQMSKMAGFYMDKPQVNIQAAAGQVTIDFGGYVPQKPDEYESEPSIHIGKAQDTSPVTSTEDFTNETSIPDDSLPF